MAAQECDDLVYDEPWGWMQPPLHALGALSLEQVNRYLGIFDTFLISMLLLGHIPLSQYV